PQCYTLTDPSPPVLYPSVTVTDPSLPALGVVHWACLVRRSFSRMLSLQVPYTLHRLTGLEKQHLFVGPQTVTVMPALTGLAPGLGDWKPHPEKGGVAVTDYFTYNCLMEDKDFYSECLRTFWSCPTCDLYMPFTPLERLQHEASCAKQGQCEPAPSSPRLDAAPQVASALQLPYSCDACQQDFLFTPTQILKHKRQHQVTCGPGGGT
ncbi:hypothetical protein scyTo_0023827, partial [Scyliorhinus torazame]|nr:hypothetical protein [Scyliorhinus torazame]